MKPKTVNSNQKGVHRHLEDVVKKHLNHKWQKPLSHFSLAVFKDVEQWLDQDTRPYILDSGCGVGDSSVNLARGNPAYKVLGFDRSEVRLDKLSNKHDVPENCLVVRADADDLWRQLLAADRLPHQHYILFPNPYPKAAQLNKRWHGSPVFPTLVKLGGAIELRSNWKTYLEEFAAAWAIATDQLFGLEPYVPEPAITAFETKYHMSQQPLWRLRIDSGTINSSAGMK